MLKGNTIHVEAIWDREAQVLGCRQQSKKPNFRPADIPL